MCPFRQQQFPGGAPPTQQPGGYYPQYPGGPGGGPGGPDGPGGGPQFGPPTGPPPAITPSKAQAQAMQPTPGEGIGTYAVSPGSLRPCRFRYVYIWPRNRRGFWAWLTRVDRRTAAGWRWNGVRWVYFGIDLRLIDSFICY
ncbi:hypothetical protein HGI79_12375 [Clostridium sp. DJ247]|nr:hypothetical protein [Clostridium sp. DJ247]